MPEHSRRVTGREEGSQGGKKGPSLTAGDRAQHSPARGAGEDLEPCPQPSLPNSGPSNLVPPLIPPPRSQAWLVLLRAWDEEGIISPELSFTCRRLEGNSESDQKQQDDQWLVMTIYLVAS